MAYNWGTALKAPLPFDGQVFVDNEKHVWQWSAANGAWMRRENLELRRVRERYLHVMGRATSVFPSVERSPGHLFRNWNQIYNLAFVELLDSAGGLLGRRAHMSLADLEAWAATVVPTSGGVFQTDVLTRVYEVFDTNQLIFRFNSWNGLYGSFRGRKCYTAFRGYGRSAPAQGTLAGYSEGFALRHGSPSLERRLMQYFYGMDPAMDQNKACWTTNKRQLYNMPTSMNATMLYVIGTEALRYCWNWGASDYTQVSPGTRWEVFNDGGLVSQNPCHVYRLVDGSMLFLDQPQNTLRGFGALVQSGNTIEGMLAFAIRNVDDPAQVAFLMKPMGVTKTGLLVQGFAGAEVMAEGYGRNWKSDTRIMNLSSTGHAVDRGGQDGHRITDLPSVVLGLKRVLNGSKAQCESVDSYNWPDKVTFYLRHGTTGVRTETLPRGIRVERRKSGLPVSLMDFQVK